MVFLSGPRKGGDGEGKNPFVFGDHELFTDF
jgi:hypothetical protein